MDGSFPWMPTVLLSEKDKLPAESSRTLNELLLTVRAEVVPALRVPGAILKPYLGLTYDVWRRLRTQRIAFAISLADDLRRDEKFRLTWGDVMARVPNFIAEHLEEDDGARDGSAGRIANILRATTTDLAPFALAVSGATVVSMLSILELSDPFAAVMDAATNLELALLAITEFREKGGGGAEVHELVLGTEELAARYQDAIGQLVVELLHQQGNPPDRTLPAPLHLPDGWAPDRRPVVPASVRGWVHGGG